MILTVANYRARMTEEIRRKRTDLTRNFIKDYDKGVPFSEELKALEAQLERINGRLPRGEFCPKCYFLTGSQENLLAASEADTGLFVRWACGACEFEVFLPREEAAPLDQPPNRQ